MAKKNNIKEQEKKLKSKRLWHNGAVFVYVVGLGGYIVLGYVVVKRFFLGWHALDLGHNVNLLNARYNLSLVEQCAGNCNLTGTQMYAIGWDAIRTNNLQMGYVGFGIGVCLVTLMYLALRGNKVK